MYPDYGNTGTAGGSPVKKSPCGSGSVHKPHGFPGMDPSHGHTISSFSAKPDETPLSSRSALGPRSRLPAKQKEPSIRADCPDGRLSKIILHVVSSTSVSHMMVPLYKKIPGTVKMELQIFYFLFSSTWYTSVLRLSRDGIRRRIAST